MNKLGLNSLCDLGNKVRRDKDEGPDGGEQLGSVGFEPEQVK